MSRTTLELASPLQTSARRPRWPSGKVSALGPEGSRNSRRTTPKLGRSIVNKERNHFSPVKITQVPETARVRPLSNGAV
ncbi:hypothetical protein AVEN_248651-1 [Araneus ventricosus]|uniref:Uncharacterized protein n=1 Tax=Araneus ventricosus TaxID=182803 RepID=A0A4Y2BZN7_ARAVE|nr:hypothetical protein AVEN_248651-1 [Araneus ventricosus]